MHKNSVELVIDSEVFNCNQIHLQTPEMKRLNS